MTGPLVERMPLLDHLAGSHPPAVLAPLVSPPLAADEAEGLDFILEGFLLHHGSARIIPGGAAEGSRVLAGDYCYAHGLVRVAGAGDLFVIEALSELIALSATLVATDRAEALPALWAATVASIARPDDALRLEIAAAKLALRRDGDPGPLLALSGHLDAAGALREVFAA